VRAFQRLQEEIMKTSTDMSISLWQGPACDGFGMLASHPSCFPDIPDNIWAAARYRRDVFFMPGGWSLNNAGISMEAMIHPYLFTDEFERNFALYLHEPFGSKDTLSQLFRLVIMISVRTCFD
jgi:hypothetical protein